MVNPERSDSSSDQRNVNDLKAVYKNEWAKFFFFNVAKGL